MGGVCRHKVEGMGGMDCDLRSWTAREDMWGNYMAMGGRVEDSNYRGPK
jgi:hypothetical protein